ncbi:MAG: hypothetical protein QW743_00780 [Candidatus Methanomethylicia archaeon]
MYFEPLPIVISKDNRVSVLYVMFSKEAIHEIGILKDLSEIIAEEGIPIIKFFSSNSNVAIFMDTTDEAKLSKVLEKLKSRVKYVENFGIHISDIKGFASISNSYPKLFGERILILRETAFKSLIECILENLKITPQIVLYLVGRRMGEEYYKSHREIFKTDLESTVRIAEKLFTLTGFGRLEVVRRSFDPLEIEYDVYDCIECKINFEAGRKIKSSLIRGLIEGYYTKLLGREVECIEEECITQEKEKCKFKIKPIEIKA